ncbi:hypothetical protein Hanom_Chr05g00430171 [Helianthus anomalus]
MLVFNNKEEAVAFLDQKELWNEIFSSLEVWKGQGYENERIAWLKFHVVPLSVSTSEVFDNIASSFGSVIQSAEFSDNGEDLSYACGGIICKQVERIHKVVTLHWKSKTY